MNRSIGYRKSILIGLFLLMTIFRALVFFDLRGINCRSHWLTPIIPCQWEKAVLEILLWVVVLFLLIWELTQDRDFKELLIKCKTFWPVFVFVILAAASFLWSILFGVTLYRAFILITSTLLAIYTGRILGGQRLLNSLTLFFSVICIASFIIVALIPDAGMYAINHAWNGIFWHKIYLGAFMALAISIFTMKLFEWRQLSIVSKIINVSMLLASIYLLIKSNSMTGLFMAVILIGICLVIAAWLRWGKYLKPIHYYIFLTLFLITALLFITNLNSFLGIFGRNLSLTNRVPMWEYLFENVIKQRPFFGYGFGTIWTLQGFREQMTSDMHFTAQITQSDNGYMDLWMYLGAVGLIVLLILVVIGLIRSIKYIRYERTVLSTLPLVLLLFAIIANCTISMLFETDFFVWSMVIASQVVIKLPRKQKISERYPDAQQP